MGWISRCSLGGSFEIENNLYHDDEKLHAYIFQAISCILFFKGIDGVGGNLID